SANRVPAHWLLTARDTSGDVGVSITASGEYLRTTPAQVAPINVKRMQESLRSLEEFGKLVSADLGRDLEAVRYRAYTLERAIGASVRGRERLARAQLYVLLSGA